MSVYKRGRVWWYKFTWNGKPFRVSTKQSNKRVAEQIEAAHKTSLAKGEVGIREKKTTPTLLQFANKPTTLAYYEIQVQHLTHYGPLAATAINAVSDRKSTRLNSSHG